MRLLTLISLSLLTAACQPAAESTQSPEVKRPTFELATSAAYDVAAIGAYTDDHAAVYDYIDANLDDHLAALQRWLRQPSISAQNRSPRALELPAARSTRSARTRASRS